MDYYLVVFVCWLLVLLPSKIGANDNQEKTFMSAGYRTTIDDKCFGIHGKLNLWSLPNVILGDYSTTLITMHRESLILAAGWMVNPEQFGDEHPRIFASYKKQKSIPCHSFNPNCTEFIKIEPNYFTAANLGQQHDVDIKIILDNAGSKKWWLSVNNVYVGYWTQSLVKGFNHGTSTLTWGGQVYTSLSDPAPMGSGKSPEKGHGQASYIQQLQYIDEHSVRIPEKFYVFESDRTLYRVSKLKKDRTHNLISFYYGGSGHPSDPM